MKTFYPLVFSIRLVNFYQESNNNKPFEFIFHVQKFKMYLNFNRTIVKLCWKESLSYTRRFGQRNP